MTESNTEGKPEKSSGVLLFQKRAVSLAKKWSSCWKGRENKGKGWYNCLCFIFRMKEEGAVCENNSKGVENQWRKEMWVISVHKSRYLNGKASQKISNKNNFIIELDFYEIHVFHRSIEWMSSPLSTPPKKYYAPAKLEISENEYIFARKHSLGQSKTSHTL